jgi:hypothetical protein
LGQRKPINQLWPYFCLPVSPSSLRGGGVSRRGEIARKMREELSGVVVRRQVRGARGGKDGGGTPKGDVERIRKMGS